MGRLPGHGFCGADGPDGGPDGGPGGPGGPGGGPEPGRIVVLVGPLRGRLSKVESSDTTCGVNWGPMY